MKSGNPPIPTWPKFRGSVVPISEQNPSPCWDPQGSSDLVPAALSISISSMYFFLSFDSNYLAPCTCRATPLTCVCCHPLLWTLFLLAVHLACSSVTKPPLALLAFYHNQLDLWYNQFIYGSLSIAIPSYKMQALWGQGLFPLPLLCS